MKGCTITCVLAIKPFQTNVIPIWCNNWQSHSATAVGTRARPVSVSLAYHQTRKSWKTSVTWHIPMSVLFVWSFGPSLFSQIIFSSQQVVYNGREGPKHLAVILNKFLHESTVWGESEREDKIKRTWNMGFCMWAWPVWTRLCFANDDLLLLQLMRYRCAKIMPSCQLFPYRTWLC